MKTFISYFKNYFTQDFNLAIHLIIGIFIASCIFLNYEFEIYAKYIRQYNPSETGLLKLWTMYLFAFFIPVMIISFFKKKSKILNCNYLLFGSIGLFFVTLDASYYVFESIISNVSKDAEMYNFIRSCISNLTSFITIVIPLFLVYFTFSYFKPELYGLRLNGANLKPYLVLTALMIPIVFAASFQEGFSTYYPSYDFARFTGGELSETSKIGIFELCYGFDFLSTELMFRGFMVVALSKFVGKDAILPMVACYAFLHFGKPMYETIGSVFGGFALGILAYKSRNIYGGLVVHLGVAWGMEFAAFTQLSWILE